MVYAFQGNAYQIGQYYLSPVYVWQANAFQFGMYTPDAAIGGSTAYTLTGTPGVIRLAGAAADLNFVPYPVATPGRGPFQCGLFQPTVFQNDCAPAAGGRSGQRPRRGQKPLRVRRKHYVEIDGQLYEVGSQREAEAILAKLHAEAMDKARRVARKRARAERGGGRELAEIVPPRAVVVEPVTAEAFTAHLQERVDATNAAIAAMYAQINASAQEWMRREEDEDDVAVLLTMGIL